MRVRRSALFAATVAFAVACGPADEEPPTADDPGTTEQPADEGDAAPPAEPGDDPAAGLPDPNEQVEAGVFRGEGVILPVPEGWSLDPAAYAQQLLLASSEDGQQQFAAQAVDTELLQQPLDFETLLDANREQFPSEPTVDEAVEVDGAAQARQLRYEDVALQPGAPPASLVLLLADDGDGRLAVFNYGAPTESFDEAQADLLVEGAAFDPDSDPAPPAPLPTAPEGGTETAPGDTETGETPAPLDDEGEPEGE